MASFPFSKVEKMGRDMTSVCQERRHEKKNATKFKKRADKAYATHTPHGKRTNKATQTQIHSYGVPFQKNDIAQFPKRSMYSAFMFRRSVAKKKSFLFQLHIFIQRLNVDFHEITEFILIQFWLPPSRCRGQCQLRLGSCSAVTGLEMRIFLVCF
jgi:hypothetical protein